ncbi:hypothetical protein TWF694_000409 [Orbilia ellipsospora]|uniref:Clr5 domain-containing protein n=1 Tax=Orbilia ellipsospora TaxID=2528407 RepID=A0AAV9XPX3_9PEZI
MTNPNPVLRIQGHTGGVTKRQWTPKANWDGIKDYVTTEAGKGTAQRTIVLNLQEQGISIELHQLKRLLKQWGMRDRNLHQRNRKYIFETEERLKKKGKSVHGWKFGDTDQRVKQTQLDRIRESDGREFEDTNATPGNLIPSPVDILLDTPREKSDETNGEIGEIFRDANYWDKSMGIEYLSPSNHSSATGSDFGTHRDLDGSSEDLRLQIPDNKDLEGPTHNLSDTESMEMYENGSNMLDVEQNDSGDLGMEENNELDLSEKNASNDPCLFEINDKFSLEGKDVESMKALLEKMYQDIVTSNLERPKLPDGPTEYGYIDREKVEILCETLSKPRRRALLEFIKAIPYIGAQYSQLINALSQSNKHTFTECRNIARSHIRKIYGLTWGYFVPTDKLMLKWLQGNPPMGVMVDIAALKVTTGLSLQEIVLDEFYSILPRLWVILEPKATDFVDLYGFRMPGVFEKDDWERFWKSVIHIPYLYSTFGLSHPATVAALLDMLWLCRIAGYYSIRLLWIAESCRDVSFMFRLSEIHQDALSHCQFLYEKGGYIQEALEVSVDKFSILTAASKVAGSGTYGPTVLQAAEILQLLYKLSRKEDARKLEVHICRHLSQLSVPVEVTNEDLWANVQESMFILRSVKGVITPASVLKISTALASLLEGPHLGIDTTSPVFSQRILQATAMFNTIKASVHFKVQDYHGALSEYEKVLSRVKAIASFSPALDQPFSDTKTALLSGVFIEGVTRVMTARGLVQYTEPILEKLIAHFESKTSPEGKRLYSMCLFAVGSAVFQMSLGEDQLGVPNLVAPSNLKF